MESLKKVNFKRISFIILFVLIGIFCNVSTAKADTDVVIKSAEIKEKSENVVSTVSVSDNKVNMDLKLYNLDDYITYKIVLKNNSDKNYTIDSVTDDNSINYIKTTYNISSKEFKKGEEVEVYLTIKYTNIIEESSLSFDQKLQIKLNYDNGESSTISVNPATGDNIKTYIILLLITIIALITIIVKSKKLKGVGLMAIATLIIPSVSAVTMNLVVNVNMNLELHGGSVATFKTGKEVNITMKKLAGAPENINHWYSDENILSIEKATDEQYNNIKDNLTEDNIVSTSDSSKIIYMWYDAGTIYWYSEASLIYLNEDSSHMFSSCSSITSLDISSFDTSNVTNMQGMFAVCYGLTELDLSSFDTSNVIDMSFMFFHCYSLTSLDISSFNTIKVTNMKYMFSWCKGLTSLDISSFDTSNVIDMSYMFSSCTSLTSLDLSSFDTSNVTNMRYMFHYCSSLTSLDLSSFDISNVEILENMLFGDSNMLTITTPKKMFNSDLEINLYRDFEDEAGNRYSALNKDTPTKITITRVETEGE